MGICVFLASILLDIDTAENLSDESFSAGVQTSDASKHPGYVVLCNLESVQISVKSMSMDASIVTGNSKLALWTVTSVTRRSVSCDLLRLLLGASISGSTTM